MRIIFSGTPPFAADILKFLLENKFNIIACYTQPDRPSGRGLKLTKSAVKLVSEQNNIPVLQPENFKNIQEINTLQQLNADLMIVAAYGIIVPETVLQCPKLGCINIHTSILPKYRGASPVQYTLLNGETTTGVTIIQMDEGMDTGDILALAKCPIEGSDNSETLLKKLSQLANTLLPTLITDLKNNAISPVKQDNTQASYTKKITKQNAIINWNDSAKTIHNQIQAYYPWPIAYSNYNSDNIKFISSEIIEIPLTNNSHNKKKYQPGTILEFNKQGLLIQCNDQNCLLNIKKLQLPSKKPNTINDLINSNPNYFKIHSTFNENI